MNASQKLLKSWWVILSFVLFINGFGFIYIGTKHNNQNWIVEGLIYEVPWFFYFIYYTIYGFVPAGFNQVDYILSLALLLFFIGIVRSFWVAVKLWDVYDNFDKYAHNPIELTNPHKPKELHNNSKAPLCCLCIAIMFFIFALTAI